MDEPQFKELKEIRDNEDDSFDTLDDSSFRKRENPLKLLKLINKTQFITFIVAFLAWTSVSFNFFMVTFTLPYIAQDFNLLPSDVAGRYKSL